MPEPIHALAAEDVRVTVLPEAGARLHSLEAFGINLLHTPQDPGEHRRDPFYWGGYHMAPWCNRLARGPITVGRRTVKLNSNFADGSAIHGQVYAARWEPADHGVFTVTGGGGGWPWTYTLTLRVTVSNSTVRLQYALSNTSDAPMPAGVGFHPWFREPVATRIPATRVFPINAATAPSPEPVADSLDLRQLRQLPDDVDATWTDLTSPIVELSWPAERVSMKMHIDAGDPVIVAANPTARSAVAVEVQTHAPAGLRRLTNGEPHPLQLLPPGESLNLGLVLAFRRNNHQEAE